MSGINTFRELEPNSIVIDLITLIDDEIKNFTTSDSFINILKKKKNENQHSQAFCNFMNLICRQNEQNIILIFDREVSQKGSSTVDIGVYRGSILFFTIEAKVLPTPKGTKSYPRNEFEYVYGKGGGVERFKKNKHGLDDENNLLVENGMIAFVKENDFDFWLQKTNQWINDATWSKSEKLKKVYFRTTAKLKSKHKRIDSSEVVLHHFWIKVS
jgi:hypothetical protein